ncbi:MAG: glycosyltransferase family 2 protein [Clostridia bacterium]|nr:glycosyltransferase family 2 protein [Clostridia bacterium]
MNGSGSFPTATELPLVSVVIPVYNVCNYLSQCLGSVIGQTYRNMEIIIIDDGSTDGSSGICDEFASRDPRIRVIHTENRGVAAARNLGIDSVRGSYVSFVDSDDWIEPDTVDTLVKTALEYKADIVAAGMRTEYIGMTVGANKKDDLIRIYRGEDILPAFASTIIGNLITNKLHLADCFKGIRFPEGHIYEDVAVTWRETDNLAKNNGTVVVLPDKFFHIRMRKGSISHTKSFGNIVDCWNAYYEKYKNMPSLQEQFIPHCFMAIGRMWGSYRDFTKEEKQKSAETIREMKSFSKENRQRVMKGNFSRMNKFICLYSQKSGPVVMLLCNWGVKLRSAFSKTNKKMYD